MIHRNTHRNTLFSATRVLDYNAYDNVILTSSKAAMVFRHCAIRDTNVDVVGEL